MSRAMLAAVATVLVAGGILTVVTASAIRRNATEAPVVSKNWEEPDPSWKTEKLLPKFQLTDRDGKLVGSDDLQGNVQVASFFFAQCPNTCFAQNKSMEALLQQFKGQPLKMLSISCNPEADNPPALKEYAKKFDAPPKQWHFLTGDLAYIRRIGGEFYQVHVDKMVHLDRLIVVDKWGKVRGSFHWKEPEKLAECKWLIEKLLAEQSPPEPAAAAPAVPAADAKKSDDAKDAEAKPEPATSDANAAESPKTESPKTESPKTESPKTESPKTESEKTEAPKLDAPKIDSPKNDSPVGANANSDKTSDEKKAE